MGIFTGGQKLSASDEYQKKIRPTLVYDGLIHIIMVDSFSKWINQNFGFEDKYTNQIDTILTAMQEDGCEIMDIKIGTLQNQGYSKQEEGFNTLIIYRAEPRQQAESRENYSQNPNMYK